MTMQYSPLYAPVAADFFTLVSVSSSASFPGGARGIYFAVSATVDLVNPSGTTVTFDNVPAGTSLWVNYLFPAALNGASNLVGLR